MRYIMKGPYDVIVLTHSMLCIIIVYCIYTLNHILHNDCILYLHVQTIMCTCTNNVNVENITNCNSILIVSCTDKYP